MPAARASSILRYLYRLVGPRHDGRADCHLLQLYLDERDEAAFAALVEQRPLTRHTNRRTPTMKGVDF
jgi:hypothetical protein